MPIYRWNLAFFLASNNKINKSSFISIKQYTTGVDRALLNRYLNASVKECDPVAQLVEHATFNRVVMGSNPIGVTILSFTRLSIAQ